MKSDKQVVPFYRKSFSSHQVYKTEGSIRTIAVLILWTWNLDINKRYSLMLVIYPPKQLWKRQTFLEKQDTPRCSNRKQEQITNDVLNFEFWTLRFSRLDFIIRDSVFYRPLLVQTHKIYIIMIALGYLLISSSNFNYFALRSE